MCDNLLSVSSENNGIDFDSILVPLSSEEFYERNKSVAELYLSCNDISNISFLSASEDSTIKGKFIINKKLN